MFNAPNPGNERRREWEDRCREEKWGGKGGVIRQVMTSGDTVILCSPSAMGELVKSALGERPETGTVGTGGECTARTNGVEDHCFCSRFKSWKMSLI